MVKHYCDICGKLMNPKSCVHDSDPDDYTWGEVEVQLGVWFKIDDVCKGCADKLNEITENEVMKVIKSKCCGSDVDGKSANGET